MKESRRFWACAGACDPHPITPMVLMPLNASGSLEYWSRPPLWAEGGRKGQRQQVGGLRALAAARGAGMTKPAAAVDTSRLCLYCNAP